MSGHMSLLAHGNCGSSIEHNVHKQWRCCGYVSGIASMTDVTGFGLRGTMNLAERCNLKGVVIDIDALPILDGASTLISDGQRSSLHGQNRAAIRIDAGGGPMPPNTEIILIRRQAAAFLQPCQLMQMAALAALLNLVIDAAIIGHLTSDYTGLRLPEAANGTLLHVLRITRFLFDDY